MSRIIDAWCVSLPCSKAEADRVAADATLFIDWETPPAVTAREVAGAHAPFDWCLDIYFDAEPDDAALAAVTGSVPAMPERPALQVAPLEPQNWTAISQAGLEPIRAGRFFVHTRAHAGRAPAGAIHLQIEAAEAFGTGHHATTTGCLQALDWIARRWRARRCLDLGTGSGILAFAMARCFAARVRASDIDDRSIELARAFARANAIALGSGPGQVELFVATGMAHPRLRVPLQFDLITANILAAPLIALSRDISRALAPGGLLVLAGLLEQQETSVRAAYSRFGLAPERRTQDGPWPVLTLRKRSG